MSRSTIVMTDRLQDYVREVGFREPPVLARLRQETAAMPMAGFQISPEQGQLMALLVRLGGVRRAIEIGTFTGYSSLCVAMALPPGGQITCCDVSAEYTAVARRYWAEAGVADKVRLFLAPAMDTLDRLLSEGEAGQYDFAFIDADKGNYDGYYERVLRLLRIGGLIAVDNVLWSGQVADPDVHDGDTEALRRFNQKLRDDRRIQLSMVSIGDGVTLALKEA